MFTFVLYFTSCMDSKLIEDTFSSVGAIHVDMHEAVYSASKRKCLCVKDGGQHGKTSSEKDETLRVKILPASVSMYVYIV